ncbi:hypothetical protein RND71_036898 [Anisodus tanguticus]|uniref:Uncharacterized protein n=1 Tax=Anisodus tanguticus TaxID=243964 RepID=A0AAE1R316_9SOLA|nr:hypothetical protein RND71_036898 [Anisodus tanguticus]
MSCKLAKNATSHTKIQSCYPELDLKGQRVAIVGLGKSRSAAMKLALARGASVIVVDQNQNLGSTFKLNGWLDEKDGDLKTVFGNFDNKLLKEADIVVVSPGVPLQNYGLFSIISSMLNHLGFETFIGGSLGVPLSEAALQCLTVSHQRPLQESVAILYFFKPLIYMYWVFILDKVCSSSCFHVAVVEDSSYQLEIPPKYFCPSISCVSQLQLGEVKAVGKHNNTNAAVAALSVVGLDIEIKAAALSSTISTLRTLAHRMQVDSDEIAWVDDSKVTNVEAKYSGLIGFEQKSVLLLGGLAKFGYSGKMIQKIICANDLTIPCLNAKSLKNVVTLARSIAERALSTASLLTKTNADLNLKLSVPS